MTVPSTIPHDRLLLGLMSGMSMDGLDMALVRLQGLDERPRVTLEASTTAPYPEALRERLQRARGPTGPESRALHAELPRAWAEAIRAWLRELGVEPAAITCIGSHGQTLWHRPRTRDCPAATLQVGDGAVLAAELGVPVVADFRSADITAGGEGAPLVPLAEWILHAGDAAGTIACNNLGSISNVTVLPARCEDILAFDTGPANMLIDAFARIHAHAGHAHAGHEGDIDRDGTLSAQGTVNEDVLLTLYMQRARWLAQEPPKSAGYGTFGPDLIDAILLAHRDVPIPDLVRTAVEFTARTLAEAYDRFVLTRFPDLGRVQFSGGGTRNPTLMQAIRAHLEPLGPTVHVVEGELNDAKEAVAFALLADRTWRALPGNVPSATGAREPVVLGEVALP